MPLIKSKSDEARSENIKREIDAGKDPKQAAAIAYSVQRRARRAVGGLAPEYVGNWWEPKPDDPLIEHGLIDGDTPGRADRRPFQVPSGAYVIPADIVSGLGEGNTMAGAKHLDEMFDAELQRHGREGLAMGGATKTPGVPVPVDLSDGEYVVSPQHVAALGFGDIRHGQNTLDSYIRQLRPEHKKTLEKLPGPVK